MNELQYTRLDSILREALNYHVSCSAELKLSEELSWVWLREHATVRINLGKSAGHTTWLMRRLQSDAEASAFTANKQSIRSLDALVPGTDMRRIFEITKPLNAKLRARLLIVDGASGINPAILFYFYEALARHYKSAPQILLLG